MSVSQANTTSLARLRVLALSALLLSSGMGPAAAGTALWEGTWTPNLGECSIPDSDGDPLVVASSTPKQGLYWQWSAEGGEEAPSGQLGQLEFQRSADPFVCYIKKVTTIVSLQGWIFDVQCGGEGEIWDTRHVLFSGNEGDELAHYDGYRTTILHRCTADDLLVPYGTNDKYGGNINATDGRGYVFLESLQPVGRSRGSYRATTLFRNATAAVRSESSVSCDPAYGETGVVELDSGEIHLVESETSQIAFTPELAYFDLWWVACRGHLHPDSPEPDWNREIAAGLAPAPSS